MEKNGYDKNMAAALVASAGGIGVIIPPSIAFVIFAMLAEISVGKLFICGIIPGIFLGICYAIAALWSIRKDKNLRAVEKCSSKERWIVQDAIWGLFIPVLFWVVSTVVFSLPLKQLVSPLYMHCLLVYSFTKRLSGKTLEKCFSAQQ